MPQRTRRTTRSSSPCRGARRPIGSDATPERWSAASWGVGGVTFQPNKWLLNVAMQYSLSKRTQNVIGTAANNVQKCSPPFPSSRTADPRQYAREQRPLGVARPTAARAWWRRPHRNFIQTAKSPACGSCPLPRKPEVVVTLLQSCPGTVPTSRGRTGYKDARSVSCANKFLAIGRTSAIRLPTTSASSRPRTFGS